MGNKALHPEHPHPMPVAVDALLRHFVAAFPAFNADSERLALRLYRQLAQGRPVAVDDLAAKLGTTVEFVEATLASWPGMYRDESGRIVGFWGISVRAMPHRLDVDGRTAYAWCAWDTLFLPALLGATVEATSRCAETGETVRLRVSPDRVESVVPASVVVSFREPDERELRENAMTNFCHFVHFFRDRAAGLRWTAVHPGMFLLPLETAFDLGRRVNAARYRALADVAGGSA